MMGVEKKRNLEEKKLNKVKIMDVKKVYDENQVTKYLIKGVTPAFINSFRRSIMTNVSCLAIDEVTFYENDSVLFDELLGNRLGLIPIKTDLKSYKKGDKVKLILEKEGPGIVTSKDIKCTDPKIEIIDKEIYIAKLGKNDLLKLEMTAVMSTGKEHARFQPALVSFNELAVIKNDGEVKDLKKLMVDLPSNSVESKAGKLFLMDPYNIKIQNPPIDILEKHGVKVEFIKNEYVFTIETTGQLEKEEVINLALDSLNEKLNELKTKLDKI
jgi:DNA-directed RNA polymerase subunit D